MKKSIRSMSLVLAFAMLAILTPLLSSGGKTVSAASDFTITNGVLTKYNGAGGVVEVPDDVTAIGASAFENNTKITEVYLPLSCTSIGNSAFYGCSNLAVANGSGIKTIGMYAFNGCTALTDFSAGYVETIGQSAFLRCPNLEFFDIHTSLKSITIPSLDARLWVSSYNQYFTMDGEALVSKDRTKFLYYPPNYYDEENPNGFYNIPTSVTTIGTYAFYKCKYIETLAIPKTVKTIETYPFGGADSSNTVAIKDIYYGGSRSEWNALISGKTIPQLSKITVHCGYEIEGGTLINYSGTDTVIDLPEGITAIGSSAFYNNTAITEVYLPMTCKSIGVSAFRECSNLGTVSIGSGVETIGNYAFIGCTKLDWMNLSYVKSIGQSAFLRCPNLPGLYLPTSLQSVTVPFCSCPVSVSSYNTYFSEQDGLLFDKQRTKLIYCPSVYENSFYCVPASVRTIGTFAFYNCQNLKAVAIPKTVTTLEDNIFGNAVSSNNAAIKDIYYGGTKAQWDSLKNGKNIWLGNMTVHFGCDVEEGKPIITEQSESEYIVIGDSLTLDVKAVGNDLTYQWYFKKSGQSDFSVWNNRTNASETVSPNATWDDIQLYCKVTDGSGKSVNSDTVTIRVLAITTQPKSQTIALGKSLTLSVKATGDGLAYQWYYKKKGASDWSVWNGRTNASETVTPNATWDGIQLYCKVTDNIGHSVNSKTATITITSTLKITTQPTSKTINLGDSVTLSLKAEGNGLTYQWYYKKKGASDWSKWNGRTHQSETVTPNATWDGIQLYCLVKDSAGNSVKSNTITVTVNSAAITITQQPKSQSIIAGKSLTLSVKATGNSLKYQWYFKKKGQSAFSVWNGRTNATETVSPNNTWDGIQLYCKITDGSGKTLNSSTMTVSVLSITTQPSNVTVAVGSNATFTVKATGSGLKYQWYYKKKGASDWSVWNGRTTASTTATANATWNGMQVKCKVTDGAGNSVTSNAATITIK